ncbi:MAG: hypothetical protein KJN71_07985 [Acidimicrobiia bacterium]|nr:hypothetical protein [Acidimicrobiia bacterium]
MIQDRGNALIEVVAGGGLIVALIVGLIVGSARLQHAQETVFEAALAASSVAVLNGEAAGIEMAAAIAPDASVTINRTDSAVTVEVAMTVHIVGFGGFDADHTVVARASEPLSPLRSRP